MEIYCRMGHIVCDDWCQTEEESKERFQGILKANGLAGFVLPLREARIKDGYLLQYYNDGGWSVLVNSKDFQVLMVCQDEAEANEAYSKWGEQ
mgnify:CR=1 FL=1|nr:MAG TPA: hypothetical protein [Caudoviricetes sp.]